MNKALEWFLASIPAFLAAVSYAGFTAGHATGIGLGILAAILCAISMFALRAYARGSK